MNQNYMKKGMVIFITILFFGALLIPNITGETIKDEENKKIIIDSNIYLSKKHLFAINQALNNIENKNHIKILTKIKEKILEKGFVDSNDIELIVKDLNLVKGGIHVGYFSGYGVVPAWHGSAITCFPGYFIFNHTTNYLGPLLYISWKLGINLNDIPIAWYQVNFHEKVLGPHSGVAILGFSLMHFFHNIYDYNQYTIKGVFALILID